MADSSVKAGDQTAQGEITPCNTTTVHQLSYRRTCDDGRTLPRHKRTAREKRLVIIRLK